LLSTVKMGRPRQIGVVCLFLFILCSAILPSFAFAQGSKVRVSVFISDSLVSTSRTLSGAKKIIEQTHPETEFNEYLLTRNAEKDSALVSLCRKNGTDIILTVGTSATKFAKDNFKDIPIIFSSVLYPALSGFIDSKSRTNKNITGASLDIPINVQFSYFKQIVPGLKKIGVLYTESTAPLIPSAKIVARDLGLTLVPRLIKQHRELPHALDSLSEVTQGLWSVADPTLFDPQSTKYILKTTLRKSIPFMGFSRHVVESGALFALDFDYKAIGIQAGQIINKVIEGADFSDLPVTSTDVIYFHFNEKTAEHIKVNIPKELVDVAKEVYK
jgi:putative ABC transport system substrate-binding protein